MAKISQIAICQSSWWTHHTLGIPQFTLMHKRLYVRIHPVVILILMRSTTFVIVCPYSWLTKNLTLLNTRTCKLANFMSFPHDLPLPCTSLSSLSFSNTTISPIDIIMILPRRLAILWIVQWGMCVSSHDHNAVPGLAMCSLCEQYLGHAKLPFLLPLTCWCRCNVS